MTDLCTQAETYLAIERELESRVADWAQRLREVGLEVSSLSVHEYMRDALFYEVCNEAGDADDFAAAVEACDVGHRNLQRAAGDRE